jgi:23S rRNA (adenine-N6)-dimethyltransferase
VGAHSRSPRTDDARSNGQHFLRSRLIAAELVTAAGIDPADHVVEIGAGAGRLTLPLAERAGLVTAVELDPALVERLRRHLGRRPNVRIVADDILRVPLPDDAWRTFGNIPFALTTAILRRLLDDPGGPLRRADLLLQLEAARKRAAVMPGTLLSLGWAPWWTCALERRVPRLAFEPPPAVDAGLLRITRREPALLPVAERSAYVSLLRTAFAHASWPARRSLRGRVAPLAWKRLARERGFPVDARPTQLDVWDWVAVFKIAGTGAR